MGNRDFFPVFADVGDFKGVEVSLVHLNTHQGGWLPRKNALENVLLFACASCCRLELVVQGQVEMVCWLLADVIAFLHQDIDHISLVAIADVEGLGHSVLPSIVDSFERLTSHVNLFHLVPTKLKHSLFLYLYNYYE